MYDTDYMNQRKSLGTIDRFVTEIGIQRQDAIVRVKGVSGLYTVSSGNRPYIRFSADMTLCNIGVSPWFPVSTEWVACSDVEVVAFA